MWACSTCPKSYSTKQGLERHDETAHAPEELAQYRCTNEGCAHVSNSVRNLKRHLKTHDGRERTFTCPEEGCTESFFRREHLVNHLQSDKHKQGELMKCTIEGCKYKTRRLELLRSHMREPHDDAGRTINTEQQVFLEVQKLYGENHLVSQKRRFTVQSDERPSVEVDVTVWFQDRNMLLLVDVDEQQHKDLSKGYTLNNEVARMQHCFQALTHHHLYASASVLWVRFNVDLYKVDNRWIKTTTFHERIHAMKMFVDVFVVNPLKRCIAYLCYDTQDTAVVVTQHADFSAVLRSISCILPCKETAHIPHVCSGGGASDMMEASDTESVDEHNEGKVDTTSTSSTKPFVCSFPQCTRSYASKTNLTRHVREEHSGLARPQSRDVYSCTYKGCSKTFTAAHNVQKHILRDHEGKKWSCEVEGCSYTANLQSNLTTHVKNKHSGTPTIYSCPFCTETFKWNKGSVRKHVQRRHEERLEEYLRMQA